LRTGPARRRLGRLRRRGAKSFRGSPPDSPTLDRTKRIAPATAQHDAAARLGLLIEDTAPLESHAQPQEQQACELRSHTRYRRGHAPERAQPRGRLRGRHDPTLAAARAIGVVRARPRRERQDQPRARRKTVGGADLRWAPAGTSRRPSRICGSRSRTSSSGSREGSRRGHAYSDSRSATRVGCAASGHEVPQTHPGVESWLPARATVRVGSKAVNRGLAPKQSDLDRWVTRGVTPRNSVKQLLTRLD
jgi:hypothetical protein